MGSRCDAGAAPATVSGERAITTCHWRRSRPREGQIVRTDPRARRPAFGAITSTGGVPGLAAYCLRPAMVVRACGMCVCPVAPTFIGVYE